MKGRILEELKKISDGESTPMFTLICEETHLNPDIVKTRASKALSNILHDYSRFSISTIDSFVQRIIQALLWEIGQQGAGDIRLDFNPVLERAADIMLDESVDNTGLFQWLQSMGETQLESGKSWDIRGGLIALGKELFSESFRLMNPDEIRQFADKEKINILKQKLNDIVGNVSNQIIVLGNNALKTIDEHGFDDKSFMFGSSGVYGFFEKCSDHVFAEILPKANSSRVLKALQSSDEEGWVKSEDRKKNPNIAQLSGLIGSKLHPLLAKLCDIIQTNESLYNSSRLVLQNLDSLAILSDLWETIRRLSVEEGFMLLADSGPLLREFVKETDAPFLYEKVGTRFDSFMIDEFQDTSVIQWQNFKPLVENSLAQDNFSMVVGDIKQAIYRWRNGDWRILSSGLENDFASLGVSYKPLDINRRSLPAIVEFNNLFFTKASSVLDDMYDGIAIEYELDTNSVEKIPNAYESVIQKTSKTNQGKGFVEFTYISDEDKKFKTNLTNYLPDLISDIQKRGYKAGDIAILVRSNKEGQELSNMLLSHKQANPDKFGSFDVVSQEGLLLVSSAAIRLIISAIRTTYQPNDSITRACLAAGLKLIAGFKDIPLQELITGDTLYPEVEWLKGFRTRPVQEVFEAILKRYGLWESKKELAYISELHEQIVNLSRKGPNDVGRFLEWWDDDGVTLALTMPDSENAITITTIHKSKGLQFPVVIVPHGDWPFSQRGKKSLLWVDSDQKPFDALPKYPISHNKDSRKNYFTGPIVEDEMQILVDNLNLLYVAFTRAENELYVFCPIVKETDKISSTSPLISKVLSDFGASGLTKLVEVDDNGNSVERYRMGSSEPFEKKNTLKDGHTSWMLDSYPAGETKANVKQHLESTDFFSTSTTGHSVSINYGKMMHNLFSRISYRSDIENALHSMHFEGLIDNLLKNELKIKIDQLLDQQPYSNWFSEEWEVKNEASVLTPDGFTYRPDRVMIKGSEVVIVDYKFGAESEKYNKQIQRYSSMIQKMGYIKVEGYLWYVDSEKLMKC